MDKSVIWKTRFFKISLHIWLLLKTAEILLLTLRRANISLKVKYGMMWMKTTSFGRISKLFIAIPSSDKLFDTPNFVICFFWQIKNFQNVEEQMYKYWGNLELGERVIVYLCKISLLKRDHLKFLWLTGLPKLCNWFKLKFTAMFFWKHLVKSWSFLFLLYFGAVSNIWSFPYI